MAVTWTDEETARLREAVSSHTAKELAVMFNRSQGAIYQACYKLKIVPKRGPRKKPLKGEKSPTEISVVAADQSKASGRPWTEADDAELARIAPQLTLPELAQQLSRTVKAVRYRCQKLEVRPLDGRSTQERRDTLSAQRTAIEAAKPKTKPEEPEGFAKACPGTLCAGALRPVDSFDWNRSGLSRRNRCRDCVRVENTERVAQFRQRQRPPDWTSKTITVDCDGVNHRCTACKRVQHHDAHYPDESSRCNFSSKCKECLQSRRNDRYANEGGREADFARRGAWTPERYAEFRAYQAADAQRRNFHLTVAQWEFMFEQQDEVCFLCREPETKEHPTTGEVMRLAVDHDHRCCPTPGRSCGRCIRGLLCYHCNLTVQKLEAKPLLAEMLGGYRDRRPLRGIEF